MLVELSYYLIGGVLSGLMAGLLGIGGGLVVIPFLAFALPYAGFPAGMVMHVAVATSLANIVVTSMMSIYSHHKRGAVLWPIFYRFIPGIIIGAITGSILAILLPNAWLEIIFGFFAFFMASKLLGSQKSQAIHPFPNNIKLQTSIFCIASFCSLLGMGGGSLVVPYLTYYNIPLRNAVGTAAACGLPIALFGLATLMVLQLHITNPMPFMSGYLYWPAFLALSVTSVLFAPLGAKLAHSLPIATLRRIFGGFLVVVGITMLYKGFF